MSEPLTWAGLSPDEHASREQQKARELKTWPEGSTPRYRLTVVDDDIDSETGVLYKGGGFSTPESAVAHARTRFPREYDYGLYGVLPMSTAMSTARHSTITGFGDPPPLTTPEDKDHDDT